MTSDGFMPTCPGGNPCAAEQHTAQQQLQLPMRHGPDLSLCCRGLRSGHQTDAIANIKSYGVDVTLSMLDVVELAEAKELIALAMSKAPLAGIFHLAMILDDRLMAQQVETAVLSRRLLDALYPTLCLIGESAPAGWIALHCSTGARPACCILTCLMYSICHYQDLQQGNSTDD